MIEIAHGLRLFTSLSWLVGLQKPMLALLFTSLFWLTGLQEPMLAEAFLRELQRRHRAAPGTAGLGQWATRLAAALLGGGAPAGSGEAGAGSRVAGQMAAAGRALFLGRQLPSLLPLLRLAGPAADEPGLQFLQVYRCI